MSLDADCVVLGAGVIGLAIARAMAQAGRDVLVIEATGHIGSVTSSRNSEVIHAGIYYRPGSLKAHLCVQGRRLLYDFCARHQVAHRRVGKLIVASDPSQLPALDALTEQARRNGVDDLQGLTSRQASILEPALSCHAAVLSPSTGIIDSHGLMLALQGDTPNAQTVFHTRCTGGRLLPNGGFELELQDRDAHFSLTAATVINACGLEAVPLARTLNGLDPTYIPRAWRCKGSYFSLAAPSPFERLIYPMPNQAGLGVHLTLDLGGQARFGPDTQWISNENYTVDPQGAHDFYAAIREYWPDLPDDSLVPAYAGIRPKLCGPGEPAADFMLSGPAQHGIPGLFNLYGIESPGLTACLAIAERVQQALAHPSL